jgi:hypothetical protein
MKTQATRRAILAGIPFLVAAGVSSSALGKSATATDPVFAAIAHHKDVYERWGTAVEAHRSIADKLWQQAEFIAQERTEERTAYLAAHPEESSHAAFQRPDDEVFCDHRSNAARELESNNTEYQTAQIRMKEAANAEYQAAIALAATTPTTSQGTIGLAQYVTSEKVRLAPEHDERQASTALLRTLAESVQNLVRV